MEQNKNLTRLSRHLCRVLRHEPELIGITIEYHGAWTNTKDLISAVNAGGKFHIDMQTLEEIVNSDEKQRYSFNHDKTKIRCNQGHSIDVDLGLKPQEPPEILYHGTITDFLNSIAEKGLLRGERQYVHLSRDEKTAAIVGDRRHKKTYILRIKAGEMFRNGYVFYLSDNGVWLTEHVPPEFLIWSDKNKSI